MRLKHGTHRCNADLLWSRGTSLYGISGPNILQYGELSTILEDTQARNKPRIMGSTQRNRNRRGNSQA
mgnify:CR=1 FL=1